MYTVSKGPSKIVQKTRRGLTQKLETCEVLQDLTTSSKSPSSPGGHGGGHGVMRSSSHGRRGFRGGGGHHGYFNRSSQEKVTPQQEEIVRYVNDKWTAVEKELERAKQGGACKVTVYQEAEPNPKLRDFEPFDLESWWGKKLYKNLTQVN